LRWRRLDEELWVRRVVNVPQKFQFVDQNTLVCSHCVTLLTETWARFWQREMLQHLRIYMERDENIDR
jgi:hypothetical protein